MTHLHPHLLPSGTGRMLCRCTCPLCRDGLLCRCVECNITPNHAPAPVSPVPVEVAVASDTGWIRSGRPGPWHRRHPSRPLASACGYDLAPNSPEVADEVEGGDRCSRCGGD